MKEFLFLFRGGDAKEIQHSPDKFKAHMDKWMVWMSELANKKQFVSAQPLTDTGMQITGTKKIISDGPYLEGKEYVGGYLVCLAESYDSALDIAKGCPILDFDDGVVEIRAIKEAE
ncbi:MAG TPA: YciI family protein [Puia sp.]|nr:YciI family protein [Puia sp.]